MKFRIVAWNCADRFARKASRLVALDADIVVVPEVVEIDAGALGEDFVSAWHGERGQHGLLLAALKPWRLELEAVAPSRHIALARLSLGEFDLALLGVWAMPGANGYVGAVSS